MDTTPKYRLICSADKQIEDHVALAGFPCMPQKDDTIQIDGIWFRVVRREFETNTGQIDGSVLPPAVVIEPVNPEDYAGKQSSDFTVNLIQQRMDLPKELRGGTGEGMPE